MIIFSILIVLGLCTWVFYKGATATVGSFKIFKKSIIADKWQAATPLDNQVYGYQTALYQDQLYIAYSHSVNPFFQKADKVLFNKFSSSLTLEDIGQQTISDDPSTGSHVKSM